MDHQAFAQLLGNYGEFVGAIAVVGTLVYLAVQVRHSKDALDANTRELEHNRRLTSAEVFENITERFGATQMQTAQNKETASIFLRGNRNPADLDDVEEHIYHQLVGRILTDHAVWWRMTSDEFLAEQYLDFANLFVRDFLRDNAGARAYWEEFQHMYPQADELNALLEKAGERSSRGCGVGRA